MFDSHNLHWQWYRNFFSVAILRYFVMWFSVVPFALVLLKFVPSYIPIWTGGGFFFVLSPSLPFNWVALWLASLFYTSALAIFHLRCPEFIKKYPSFSEYKAVMHSPRWMVWQIHDAMNKYRRTALLRLFLKEKPDRRGRLEPRARLWVNLKRKIIKKKYAVRDASTSSAWSGGREYISKPYVGADVTHFCFEFCGAAYKISLPIFNASGDLDKGGTDVAEQDIFWEVFAINAGSRKLSRMAIIILLLLALILFVFVLVQHILSALPFVASYFIEELFPRFNGLYEWVLLFSR